MNYTEQLIDQAYDANIDLYHAKKEGQDVAEALKARNHALSEYFLQMLFDANQNLKSWKESLKETQQYPESWDDEGIACVINNIELAKANRTIALKRYRRFASR